MKKINLLLLSFLFTTNLFAANSKGLLSIEPIVGYEQVQTLAPTPHSKNRLIYGLRAIYGFSFLAAEAELTQGNDTESFPVDDLTIKESVINAKLGIRSNFINTQFFNSYLRAGGHARQSEIETTDAGVTTVEKPAVKISPYAGAGFGLRINNMFRFNLGITAIFTGEPKGSDRDYQTTAGFSIKI